MTDRTRIERGICIALLAVSAALSPFWGKSIQALVPDGLSYAERRDAAAFSGVPIRSLTLALASRLPQGQSIALGGSIARDTQLTQRLTEGLYPRVIDATSRVTLDISSGAAFDGGGATSLGTELARAGDMVFILRGGGSFPPTPGGRPEEMPFLVGPLVLAVLSAIGLGLLTLWICRAIPWDRPALILPAALVASVAPIGLAYTLAAWIGLPLPSLAMTLLGGVGLIVMVPVMWRRRAWIETRWRPRPETWCIAALLTLFAVRVAVRPVSLWDGRSIWLFQARRIATHGGLTATAAIHPDVQWSHTGYPLFFPSWLSHFTASAGSYSERSATLGIPILFAALIAVVWIVSRNRLGRWPGAALAFAVFFSLERLSAGAYVDGFLLLVLLVQFLALFSSDGPAVTRYGWIAALIASCLKLEGVVLSLVMTSVYIAFRHRSTRPFLLYVPAVGHMIWAKRLGLRGDFDELRLTEVLTTLGERVMIVLSAMPPMLWKHSLLLLGFLGLVGWISVFRQQGRAPDSRSAFIVAIACLAFALGTMVVTPLEPAWHVPLALDRLLLHPAGFFVLSLLLALKREAVEASGAPGRTSAA